MTRIFGWSADNSGCEWYRLRVPLASLRAHYEADVMVGRLLVNADIARKLGQEPHWRPDVLIGQRVSNPAPSSLWQALARGNSLPVRVTDVPEWAHAVLRGEQPRPAMIYELDDDLLDVDPSNVAAYREFGRPEIRANIRANLAAADAVTVTTAPLAAVVRQHTDAPVHVVPNYLPDWLPVPVDEIEFRCEVNSDRTVIGWAGGSSHALDWNEAGPTVMRFVRRSPIAEMHLVGARWVADSSVRFTKWSPRVPDFYRSLDFDIGLAPLRPSVFNRSKSPVKVMEYGALGIVPIASNVGPYADYIEAGHDGLLVDQPHQWGIALRMLTGDHELRATLARNAWEKARDNTISNHVAEWAAVIEEVLHAVVQ